MLYHAKEPSSERRFIQISSLSHRGGRKRIFPCSVLPRLSLHTYAPTTHTHVRFSSYPKRTRAKVAQVKAANVSSPSSRHSFPVPCCIIWSSYSFLYGYRGLSATQGSPCGAKAPPLRQPSHHLLELNNGLPSKAAKLLQAPDLPSPSLIRRLFLQLLFRLNSLDIFSAQRDSAVVDSFEMKARGRNLCRRRGWQKGRRFLVTEQ